MRMISVSEEVCDWISKNRRDKETDNQTLERVLFVSARGKDKGKVTSQMVMMPFILKCLSQVENHCIRTRDMYSLIKHEFRLTPKDLETDSYGNPRWHYNVRWARAQLCRNGELLLPQESGRGYWILSTRKG